MEGVSGVYGQDKRDGSTLAAAYVRGVSLRGGISAPAEGLLTAPLDELSTEDKERLIQLGRAAELKMYRFKDHNDLPRVQRVMGFLKGVWPENLLDVGSGRGVFLFPFLCAFPGTPVVSLDLLKHRVEFLEDIRSGGVEELTPMVQDICTWDMPEKSFDVVTLLEVLEHIPEVDKAVAAAVKMARKYVVVSVPSKEDDNPEHIHLLTKDILTKLFSEAGCTKLHFSGVNGHLIMMATIE